MWAHKYITENGQNARNMPVIILSADIDSDGAIKDYKIELLAEGKLHNLTKIFTNNWPVFVEDLLQETRF